jgi:putative intracellular protease/amidase/YHS domain-containing protein
MKNTKISRRELLQASSVVGLSAAVPMALSGMRFAGPAHLLPAAAQAVVTPMAPALTPPASGRIPVAFVMSAGAVVIDYSGPWEVFQDVNVPGRNDAGFQLYTVSETTKPIEVSGGMKVTPDYSFDTAPAPKVIVIPAQGGAGDATFKWIGKASENADVVMSVCTGAFILAKTGLLNGKEATTHHASYSRLAMQFPHVRVKRGARFVEAGKFASAGGLSSGIDLALRVVERYYGHELAQSTAFYMEYQGKGWMEASGAGNEVYLAKYTGPVCAVCGMLVDTKTALNSDYKSKKYYFCYPGCKEAFDAGPAEFATEG